jgi:hypothetical protein
MNGRAIYTLPAPAKPLSLDLPKPAAYPLRGRPRSQPWRNRPPAQGTRRKLAAIEVQWGFRSTSAWALIWFRLPAWIVSLAGHIAEIVKILETTVRPGDTTTSVRILAKGIEKKEAYEDHWLRKPTVHDFNPIQRGTSFSNTDHPGGCRDTTLFA